VETSVLKAKAFSLLERQQSAIAGWNEQRCKAKLCQSVQIEPENSKSQFAQVAQLGGNKRLESESFQLVGTTAICDCWLE